MAASPVLQPVTISQMFGERPDVYRRFGLPGHNGLDFACEDGNRVLAPADGAVLEVAYDAQGYGWYVKLLTPAGEHWLVAHMHFWHLPQPGEWVAQGAVIGNADNSGFSSGTHVHLGYRPDGDTRAGPWQGWADPLPHLDPF
jgi:murein DD-endopeptidase MepM/ murein hydrolase activator NlpD